MDKYYKDKNDYKEEIINEVRDLWMIESKESKKYDKFGNFLNLKREEAGKKYEKDMKSSSDFITNILKLSKLLRENNIELSIDNLLDDKDRYKFNSLVKELLSILQ